MDWQNPKVQQYQILIKTKKEKLQERPVLVLKKTLGKPEK